MELVKPATISAAEAANYTGISYGLLLKMARNNQIPFIHAGDRYLFRKETLDTWMREQEQKSMHPQQLYGVRKIKG